MPSTVTPTQRIVVGLWIAVVPALVAAVGPACAGSDPDATAAPDIAGASTAGEPDMPNHWKLGAGAAVMPRFQGSDHYKTEPVPLVDVKIGRFFATVGEGIGFNIVQTPSVTAGVSANWMQGYDSDDVPAGIRGVDDALGARVFVSARYNGAIVTLAATQAVTDTDRGLLVNAGLAYPLHVTERLALTPGLGITWANGRYMDSYFGIDPSESAASGLDRYRAASGLRDVSFRIGASYRLTDSLTAVGMLGVAHLLGEASRSPLVERKTQPMAAFGLTYAF